MTFPYIKGPGRTAAHPRSCLPLLPSGPDGVHKLGLRWAWPRTSGRSAETIRPGLKDGGDERIRTADPLVANEVLSQLSYIPMKLGVGAVREAGPDTTGARILAGRALRSSRRWVIE